MSNWWADRLSGNPAPPRTAPSAPPSAPPPTPAPRPPSYQRTTAGAEEDRCPACNSQNYMAAPGSKYKRCYDCGYPITQSGSGVVSTSSDTSATPAVQVAGGGFNPKQIVGRIE